MDPNDLTAQIEAYMEPVSTDSQIDSVIDVSRATENRRRAMQRIEQALAKQSGAEGDFWGSIAGTKGVPTPFGTVVQRVSPMEKVIAALRTYRAGRDVNAARTDEMAAGEAEQQGKGAYERMKRDQADQYNRRLLAALVRSRSPQAAAPESGEALRRQMDPFGDVREEGY